MAFGRFERTPAPQPMSEINMTPLVDVMLVLVVILILTAPLLVNAVKLELPKADGSTPVHVTKPLTVTIDPSGQFLLDEQPVDANMLGAALQKAALSDRETELQLRADTRVPYGRVVEVMGLARKAGLHRIGFLTDIPAATNS